MEQSSPTICTGSLHSPTQYLSVLVKSVISQWGATGLGLSFLDMEYILSSGNCCPPPSITETTECLPPSTDVSMGDHLQYRYYLSMHLAASMHSMRH